MDGGLRGRPGKRWRNHLRLTIENQARLTGRPLPISETQYDRQKKSRQKVKLTPSNLQSLWAPKEHSNINTKVNSGLFINKQSYCVNKTLFTEQAPNFPISIKKRSGRDVDPQNLLGSNCLEVTYTTIYLHELTQQSSYI